MVEDNRPDQTSSQGAPVPPESFGGSSGTRPPVSSSSLTDQGRAAAAEAKKDEAAAAAQTTAPMGAQSAQTTAPMGAQAAQTTAPMGAQAAQTTAQMPTVQDASNSGAYTQPAPDAYAQQGYQGYSAPHQTYASAQQTYATQQQTYAAAQAPYQQPASHTTEKKKSGKGMALLFGIIGVVVGALIVGAIAFGVTNGSKSSSSGTSNTTTAASSTGTSVTLGSTTNTTINASDDTTVAEAVASKAMPSVVSIKVYEYQTSSQGGYYYYGNGSSLNSSGSSSNSGKSGSSNSGSSNSGSSNSGSSDSDLTYYALGSGVIISSDGYIVTNYHVVESGDVFVVYFDDDSSAKATVVATDESSDLAVLKVDKTGLTPIEIGDSDNITVGEWCATIGAPFGMEKSISAGIVSALYRSTAMDLSETSDSSSGYYGYSTSQAEYAYYANMIQTDADINPGNSGGALVDSNGKLIGICVMTYSYSGSSSGVSCAIPVNYAISIAKELIENGSVQHPLLGVTLDDVDASTVDNYDVSSSYGAYIKSVESGSSAEKAGLKAGDVVVSYNGQKITSASGLLIAVKCTLLGSTVDLGVQRGGQDMTISVTLDQASTTTNS